MSGSNAPAERSLRFCSLAQVNQDGVFRMAVQIVMDRSGDTRHTFDTRDRAAVEEAEKRFTELTGMGFTAAVRTGPGHQRVVRSFDPAAEETLFFPRLVGG
jgi:Cdc6-like AAA superfamily ATPase